MLRRAVLDSTIPVSASLTPGGAADVVLRQGIEGTFTCCLADAIIAETVHRLRPPRLQARYTYTAEDVDTFKATRQGSFLIIADLPPLTGIIRDPNDDMTLACGVGRATRPPAETDGWLRTGPGHSVAIITSLALMTA